MQALNIDKRKLFRFIDLLTLTCVIELSFGFGACLQYLSPNYFFDNLKIMNLAFWLYIVFIGLKLAYKGYEWYKNKKAVNQA
jgi:hypothetical protein